MQTLSGAPAPLKTGPMTRVASPDTARLFENRIGSASFTSPVRTGRGEWRNHAGKAIAAHSIMLRAHREPPPHMRH